MTALDDIRALALTETQADRLRHGQAVQGPNSGPQRDQHSADGHVRRPFGRHTDSHRRSDALVIQRRPDPGRWRAYIQPLVVA